ncbi:MAG: DUF5060 domain-containing protein, partial [Granulosicoccus sp.]|nr:DUF5060 domain-containing protein [Granulosicoccus sp.]
MRQTTLIIALALNLMPAMPVSAASIQGSHRLWQPHELIVEGPPSHEHAESPNPFLDIRLDVILTSPSGGIRQFPGFFAGDGQGGGTGKLWKVRFTPDEAGEWQYAVRLQQGDNIAVAGLDATGVALPSHGDTGTFQIGTMDPAAPGFLSKGPLYYVGEHYLQFADGTYWIKGGVDSPENFLGYAGFDNTVKQSGGVRPGSLPNQLHAYQPHIEDWQTGDPLFTSADTDVDSKGIIGAVNYLSSQGVNSIYMLMMNLGGDGRDVYPFIGTSGSHFDNTHYDISKLYQWNLVFDHMQRRAVAAHMVLGEQETGNTQWLDEGTLGIQRRLYYRELVARFSYLSALKWNLSEESRFTDEQHRTFAAYLRSIDPVAHPIGVHHWVDNPAEQYEPLLGNTDFEITSIQFHPDKADEFTEQWRTRSTAAGWPWVIDMDEQGPGNLGLSTDNIDEMRKAVLYPVYFSGGNIEWYFGRYSRDIGLENFRAFEPMYRYMKYARELLQEQVPFQLMKPNDGALTGGHQLDQVFELSAQHYLLYMQDGNDGRQLELPENAYRLRWFDPRNGRFAEAERLVSGGSLSLGPAPGELAEDWVVLIDATDQSPEPEPEPEP